MSVYEYTEPPTITVNGVRLPVERVTFGALRSADPHVEAVVATRAAFAEMPRRAEFTVADDGGLFDRIARMVAEATAVYIDDDGRTVYALNNRGDRVDVGEVAEHTASGCVVTLRGSIDRLRGGT